mgnify:FL=1
MLARGRIAIVLLSLLHHHYFMIHKKARDDTPRFLRYAVSFVTLSPNISLKFLRNRYREVLQYSSLLSGERVHE